MKRLVLTYLIPLVIAVGTAFLLYKAITKTDFTQKEIKLEIVLDAFQESELQFMIEDDEIFKIENIQTIHVPKASKHIIELTIPSLEKSGRLRIDPSYTLGKWNIHKITLKGLDKSFVFSGIDIVNNFSPINHIKTYEVKPDGTVYIESNGNDSNLISNFYFKKYEGVLNQTPYIYLFPLLLSICFSILVLYALNKKLQYFNEHKITSNHILLLSFICLISMPAIWMNLLPTEKISESENRVLKSKPVFNFANILSYPKEFTEYFEDNFGFKKTLTSLNSYYKLKAFHASSKPNSVNIGKDNWLFSVDPINSGDYQNKKIYTPEELTKIKHNLEEAKQWHEKRGIHFFVMILPIKSSIYTEYLPDNMKKKNNTSKLIQLRDYLENNSSAKIIDLTRELLDAKKTQQVYYKQDIHWNFDGGYLGYKKLIQTMSEFNSDLKPITLENYKKEIKLKTNADLSKQLSLETILANEEPDYKRTCDYPFEEISPPEYSSTTLKQKTRRTIIRKSRLPKAIVYRDSFFNMMITFFSENFSDCVYLWTDEMSQEVIEKEAPNFVVYEMIEANIDKLLEDNPDWMKENK